MLRVPGSNPSQPHHPITRSRGKRYPWKRAFSFCLIALLLLPFTAPPLPAQQAQLIQILAEKNLQDLDRSLADGSYRGEEGLLRVRPEVGKSFGIKVYLDQDYADSVELFKKGEAALEKAKAAMASREKESSAGEHAKNIARHMLSYRAAVESARHKLLSYRSKLNPAIDDRLNESISKEVMARVLTESLNRTHYQLRDALGYLYNVCRGTSGGPFSLTPENVAFVNEVFRRFLNSASEETRLFLNFDRQEDYRIKGSDNPWKNALQGREFPYLDALEETLAKFNAGPDAVDPLLFVSLMKRESGFDALAVSPAGAVGLTQIMPRTALNLGMQNVFTPGYLDEASTLSRLERITKARASATLFQINQDNRLVMATQARELMQKALAFAERKESLYAQYRRELLRDGSDDRLNPSQAIEFGFRYFLTLMREQKGDISLALAAYNAGPHRVKEYQGIPPFPETVHFRNKVLEFYAAYQRRLRIPDQSL